MFYKATVDIMLGNKFHLNILSSYKCYIILYMEYFNTYIPYFVVSNHGKNTIKKSLYGTLKTCISI